MGPAGNHSEQDRVDEFLHRTTDLQSDPAARWRTFTGDPFLRSLSFDACLRTWKFLFAGRESHLGPAPCWLPGSEPDRPTHLARWMEELSIGDAREFHQWSVEKRESFWEMTLEELQIAFRQEPVSIFDSSADSVETPRLLPGARLNIVESCFQAAENQVAVISGGPGSGLRHHTYGELRSEAARVASALVEQGYQPGDRIGVVLPMTFDSIAIYLGILQAGLVAVSIADSFASPEIANRLRIAKARAVFTFEKLVRAGRTFELGARVTEATHLPVHLVDRQDSPWNQCKRGQGDDFDAVIGDPMDAINILFSSGTTGDPKAIPWNHATPLKCATDGQLHQDLQPGDVVAWPTNLGWMMGPWLIFATLINRGTIAVYEEAPFGEDFGRFVQDARVNMLGLVPSMVRLWRSGKTMEKFDWSAIRCFSSTGEASNVEDMFYLSWLAGFRPIIEYCGGTEIGGGYISSTLVQPNAPSTFSIPSFGLDLEILDERGQPADEGELFLIPPSIGLSSELLNRDHRDTYFGDCPVLESGLQLRRHGDYFCRLGNGYFAAGGRADDTMNLGGIKVSSVEIEKIINQLPGVSESAAVAVPLDMTGPEQLVVFVVAKQGAPWAGGEGKEDMLAQLLKAMNQEIRTRLNPLFKIGKLVLKPELPRTASNKVLRRQLRDELLAG
ncbi:MAG: AMP-binding protein [Planctomycetota bacterium]|nr:AMP-binding protein [Planctomycetota bacterium]